VPKLFIIKLVWGRSKGLKFEFAIEAIIILIKSIKKALSGMFVLLVTCRA